MTSRDRIINALAGLPVDHVPFCPFLAYVWDFFSEDVRKAGDWAFLESIGADILARGTHSAAVTEVAGVEHRSFREEDRDVTVMTTPVGALRWAYMYSEAGKTGFIVEHPLKTEEDYKVQMWVALDGQQVFGVQTGSGAGWESSLQQYNEDEGFR